MNTSKGTIEGTVTVLYVCEWLSTRVIFDRMEVSER